MEAPDGPRRQLPRGPRHPSNFPDPFVLHDEPGRWFAYGSDDNGCHVQTLTSSDLDVWQGPTDALPSVARWADADRIWSPSVAKVGDGYVLYYSIHKHGSRHQAISVATATQPQGPFVDVSDEPLVFDEQAGGSIDPSPFLDADGRRYLLWKADSNAVHQPSTLWIQEVSPDGVSLADRPTEVLKVDAGWEGPLIEAPSMLLVADTYYLFYSGNWFYSPSYAIGYATATSVRGPFKKRTTVHPWVGLDDVVWGPGGQEWTTDDDGGLVMTFHGWEPGLAGYKKGGRRRLYVATVDFVNGRPVLGEGPARSGRRWWPFGRSRDTHPK